jgi:beta-galactosidase
VSELVTRQAEWSSPEGHPDMANSIDVHNRIRLTSRTVLRDGVPWIPVSGEIHYSRVARERWRERLLLMKSGGVDVISSYVIWIHHEAEEGQARFDGNLDIAAFVRLCDELGLHFILRVGPWVHAEVRNGGFPDWVQNADVVHRTDDPAYLDLVRAWFAKLGTELAGLCGPDSPIVGIQIENELYDQPEHLSTLKQMAREVGLTAPFYTATAWGGAELPGDEFFPLYSGYGDGFWVDADAPWDDTFRQHYFFSNDWDDPGVGADVRGVAIGDVTAKDRNTAFPPATCELGGGMATTYHRRIVPTAEDIAAVGNAKIGSGSAWQGYYMYAGGQNPAGGPFQESHTTGYPNDLPTFDYDFHAAVGSAGQVNDSHALLRQQHAFLSAFGQGLSGMPAAFPENGPRDVDDASTLRWAVRASGGAGFVFVNWHQPHIPLPTLRDIHLTVEHPAGTVEFGAEGIDVAAGTIARWPFGLELQNGRVNWATASALTVLDDGTLVLVAEPGLDARISLGTSPEPVVIDGEVGGLVEHEGITVLVIGRRDARRVWVLDGARRWLVLSDAALWSDGGELVVRDAVAPAVRVWDAGEWRVLDLASVGRARASAPIETAQLTRASEPPRGYGTQLGRPSAPSQSDIESIAAEYRLIGVGEHANSVRRDLRIDWAGDVAQLLVGGVVVADRFWDGSAWHIDLDLYDGAVGDAVSVRIVPLHRASEVRLPAAATDRRLSTAGALQALDAVSLARSTEWRARL